VAPGAIRPTFLLSIVLIVTALAVRPDAGVAAVDPRLSERLDPETASRVGELVEQAKKKGLPADALVARALEGASRQATGARIIAAVQNLSGALETSRDMLGDRSAPAELVAGAAALAAGVPPDTLASLRGARGKDPLVVPLVVLTDLVTRQVPLETACAAVLAASRKRVNDSDLMRLRQRIDQDIRAGASPGNATILRTRKLIGGFQVPPGTHGSRRSGP
jgi:hypothetical protein